jgi:serine/threonine-protein kinase HipA
LPTVKRVFEETADALSKIAPDAVTYFKNKATHRDIGDRLLAAWEAGVQHSLGFADR